MAQTTKEARNQPIFAPRSLVRSVLLRPRVLLGVGAGVAALLFLPSSIRPAARSSLAWDVGGIVYLILALQLMVRTKAETLKARAARADESGIVILGLILVAIAASFAAMSGLAGETKEAPKFERHLALGLAAATLVVSWLVTQFVFTIHYAHRYYSPGEPRLAFPGNELPDYWDFLYFSTSIGAASQTSDVNILTGEMRRLVTLHAIVSFFFNTMVLALTINLAASLV